jgi:hypothetical protein
VSFRLRARVSWYLARFAVVSAALSGACGLDQPTLPALSGESSATSHPQAFTIDVNTRARSISVRPPAAPGAGSNRARRNRAETASLSLLAGDVVSMRVSNLRTSAIGSPSAGRVRVTFDVAIENRLAGIRLITPTWPTPPASGVILVPIGSGVTSAPGTVSGDGGSAVIVTQPRLGRVVPSADFDGTGAAGSGAPYSFFNDAVCTDQPSGDCFRWKLFEGSIAPQSVSTSRTVGFEVDATVAQFRAFMIVAADLAPDVTRVGARVSRSRSPSP